MPDIQNAEDYKQYEAAVAHFINDFGLSHLSTGTYDLLKGEDPETGNQDPWFSKYPCECCRSPLGGNREYLYARDEDDELVQFQICYDCVYYLNYGRLDDQTMERVEGGEMNPHTASLAETLAKTARILSEDDQPNSDSVLQALVGDPNDTRISTFTQFKPNPGGFLLPNPASPVEGDEVFFNFLMPGSRFQAHDGSDWVIQDYTGPDNVEIYNYWYPQTHPIVSIWDIRRSIHQWTSPVTQTVPPPPTGVDYAAQLVRIADKDSVGRADENTSLAGNMSNTGGW